ncbi:hypothetical protein GCM10020258_03690 [Sphingomonas yabuuchiae]
MMQPAEPFRRNPAGIVRAVIDHPAACAAGGVGAALIIDVAMRVLANLRLAAQTKPGADGGAVPPGEGIEVDAHDAPCSPAVAALQPRSCLVEVRAWFIPVLEAPVFRPKDGGRGTHGGR